MRWKWRGKRRKGFEHVLRWLSLSLSTVKTRTLPCRRAGGAQATVREGPTVLAMRRSHPTSSITRQSRGDGEGWAVDRGFHAHLNLPSVVVTVGVYTERRCHEEWDP